MKNFSLFILILVFPIHVLPADLPANPQGDPRNQDKAKATTKQSTPNKTKKSKIVRSKRFVPSEKISADVAVSFPADI